MGAEGKRLFETMNRRIEGDGPGARAEAFFAQVTDAFLARPKLAGAILRALVGGGDIAARVVALQGHTTSLLTDALDGDDTDLSREDLETIATILQQVWFACLIGWTGGLYADGDAIVAQVRKAVRRLLPAG